MYVCMCAGNGDREYLTKLHFQLRLKARDFNGVSQLHAEAERITDIVQGTTVCIIYVCMYVCMQISSVCIDVCTGID